MEQLKIETTQQSILEREETRITLKGNKPFTAEDMSFEGAVELVGKLLSMTYHDYVNALRSTNWSSKKKSLTSLERHEFINALRTKDECERFYLSDTFQIFTLGQGPSGEDVIKKIQKIVESEN